MRALSNSCNAAGERQVKGARETRRHRATADEKAFDQYPNILAVKAGSRVYKSCTVAIIREALRNTATTDGAYLCCLLKASSGPLRARVKNVR